MRCAAWDCDSGAALIRSPSTWRRLECVAIFERHRLFGTDCAGGASLGKRGIAVGDLGIHVPGLGDFLGAGEGSVLVWDADPHVLSSHDTARGFPGFVVALGSLRVTLRRGLLASAVGAGACFASRRGILRIRLPLLASVLCFRLSLLVAGFFVTARLVGGLSRLIGARLPVALLAFLGTAFRPVDPSS